MKQCWLSYGTSQSNLSENYLYPFCHGYLGYSNVNIAGILLLLDMLTFLFAGSGSFINLCYHHKDFGVDAEWHFSATSHGKGACDGVGGTV